jgi:arylsulfatase A-like enzyme
VREPGVTDGLDYVDRYDEETAYFDREAGRLLAAWKKLGLSDGSVVIFTADHGESMMDHEKWFRHDYHVYEELVHVPLAVSAPSFPSKRVKTPVTNLDIAPLLLRFAGVPVPDDLDARQLAPNPEPRPIFVESAFNRHPWRGVVDGKTGHKYMAKIDRFEEPTEYLERRWYDLPNDPDESNVRSWPPEKKKWSAAAQALVAHIQADQDLGRKLPRHYKKKGRVLRRPKVPPSIAPDVTDAECYSAR